MSVVETGSFVGGGKALGLSRSAAGKAVARLENRFAARLLNRTTRSLGMTEEGRTLYQHGQSIQAAMDAAEGSIAGGIGQPRGVLRVAVPDGFGRRLMMPVVRSYLAAWPEVQLEMSFSDKVSNLVEEGFDLAIRIGVTSPNRGLTVRTIMTDEPVLCAAPAYLDRMGEPASAEQLSTHDLLLYESQNERQNWRLQEQDGTWIRAQGQSRLRIDSGEALCDAALAGMGIALLPGFLVGELIDRGSLRRVLPKVSAGTVGIVALYPHRKLLEPRVRQFIDMLVAMLARQRRASLPA